MILAKTDKYNLDTLKQVLCASFYDESAWRMVEGPMPDTLSIKNPVRYFSGHIRRRIVKALGKRGLLLVRRTAYDTSLRENGLDWPLFGYTMIGRKRLDNVQACIEDILKENVPGDFIETGVWRGGAVILMKATLDHHGIKDRKVWCADSFEGLPPPNAKDQSLAEISDFSDRDFLAVSQEQVEANFARFGLLDAQIKFLKGWFSETLPTAPIEQLALLRLDGDLYESTMDALSNLYPKMSPGGYVVIDDYGSWAGCREAVDEYRKTNAITAEMQQIDQHAYFWKIPA